MDAARVISVASNLISDDAENPEYDRAISEMTCDLLGISMDYKDEVAGFLRGFAAREVIRPAVTRLRY